MFLDQMFGQKNICVKFLFTQICFFYAKLGVLAITFEQEMLEFQ